MDAAISLTDSETGSKMLGNLFQMTTKIKSNGVNPALTSAASMSYHQKHVFNPFSCIRLDYGGA